MLSIEKNVKSDSDYYIYTPSMLARKLFFYPTIIGRFDYEPGYWLHRNHFDSFLLMIVESGTLEIMIDDKKISVPSDRIVLIDTEKPHEYGTSGGCRVLWFHFNGPLALAYFKQIISTSGNVVLTKQLNYIRSELFAIYQSFRKNMPLRESDLSMHIESILISTMNSYSPNQNFNSCISKSVAYINEHFPENLSLDTLAEAATLSPYYFSRLFAKETGLTPHQYLLDTRISNAKYMLTTTDYILKEIADRCGFSDESSFCTTFRKRTGMTPLQYKEFRQKKNPISDLSDRK